MKRTSLLLVCAAIASLGLGPRLSPSPEASSRIAFVANLDGNWDLLVANEDGTDLERLTKTPYDEKAPSLSPDGREVAYAATDGIIRIMNLGTRAVEDVPKVAERTVAGQPCFSPSGDEVVFVSFSGEKSDDSDLAVYDRKEKVSKVLLTQVSVQLYPSWSPDGSSIAYSNVHCSMECGRVIQEVWVFNVNARRARQVTLTNSLCLHPSWSPDGKKLVLSSDMSGNFDLYIYDFDTDSLRALTTDPAADLDPCWSRDGKRIVFTSSRSDKQHTWILDPADGELVAPEALIDEHTEHRDPTW